MGISCDRYSFWKLSQVFWKSQSLIVFPMATQTVALNDKDLYVGHKGALHVRDMVAHMLRSSSYCHDKNNNDVNIAQQAKQAKHWYRLLWMS